MKKIFLIFLFIFATQPSTADFKTYQFDSYDFITELVYTEMKVNGTEDLLVIFDIDRTLFENIDCLPENIDITNGFLLFEERVRRCEGHITSPVAPALINELKNSNVAVMALTARRSVILDETLSQLEERLVFEGEPFGDLSMTFETAPSYSENKVVIDFEDFGVFNKNLAFKRGVAAVGGADKGIALKAFLKHHKDQTGEDFSRIIFIDDDRRNIRNLEEVFENTKNFISIVHYTEFEK